ncbi:hypothetical protein [Melittangium boletus]|uniref:Uncharacterized protein n=1 Tax=Melittangium boletus DSM 14713 TaxID=1294270 RepID=A0A250IFL6_9BACT|nr:hypothetical protein [Melittangium boletus]ATB29957.1 hypothetical protein MEBOL_003412 [Melittangium boletus DSM 14713]
MSVRLGQPAPGIAPRPQQQQQQALTNNPKLRDDPRAKDTGKGSSSSGKAGDSGDKGVSGGGKGGAKALRNRDGMDTGGQVGSYTGGGYGGIEENTNARFKSPAGRAGAQGQHNALSGYPQSQGGPQAQHLRESPSAAQLDLPREQQRAGGEREQSANAARQALEGRAKLRAAVLDRLLHGMKDVHGRLAKFLKNPGRLGVVNLSLVLSESSITYELWKEPSGVPERRARMAQTLGVPPELSDAMLLRALMTEVHECFEEFMASRPGREIRAEYEEVLAGYEAVGVLPVMPGFDTGPMQAELTRVGLPHDKDFARSILIDPQILAVGISPDDGVEPQVMVAGLSVAQLGTIIAQLRRLNPRLTNRQVLNLMMLASTDIKKAMRKALGQSEVDGVQEMARQLLRLQAVELLYP